MPNSTDSGVLRVECSVRDGEVFFEALDGGLMNFKTTGGHLVTVDNSTLKSITLFLMNHIFSELDVR